MEVQLNEADNGSAEVIDRLSASPQFSVVVPTFNERVNVAELVKRVRQVLRGVDWEIIFVDDNSADGTVQAVRELAHSDRRVRCLHRVGRRGLASACIEGILSSSAPFVAVMDADLQHDEALLLPMYKMLNQRGVDIVIGSRYVEGGGLGSLEASRVRKSQLATRVAKAAIKSETSDPMSGFFSLRRDAFMAAVPKLSGIGFKILLDILASSPVPLRVGELPYEFRERTAGESKLDSRVVVDYLMLLIDKTVGRFIPARLFMFMAVGSMGVVVHMFVLTVLFKLGGLPFMESQAVATFLAMTFNFTLNNELTYRDQRLQGWKWLVGLMTFTLACSVGLFANVGVASYLFQNDTFWLMSAVAGILVGVVWNYAVTSVFTWKK